MELECKKLPFRQYERIHDAAIPVEETMEYIVPDYCPDIGRILYTDGSVFLRSKEYIDGKIELNGVVKAAVLYLPENSSTLRSMEVVVPFTCRSELKDAGECVFLVQGRLQEAEARLLNPRKLLLRVNVVEEVAAYSIQKVELIEEITAEEEMGLQQKNEDVSTDIIKTIKEKDFTFMDEICLPSNKEEIEEILSCCYELQAAESKVLGEKVVINGQIYCRLLYRSVSGQLCSWEGELPLHQVVDVEKGKDDSQVQINLQVIGCEQELSGEGSGRCVTVNLFIKAQLVLWENCSLQYVADTYSTRYNTSVQRQPLMLMHQQPQQSKRQNIHELLEIGIQPKQVAAVRVYCTPVHCVKDTCVLNMQTTVHISVVYLDENSVPLAAQRQIEVHSAAEVSRDSSCTARALCQGEIYAAPSNGGVDIRFSIDFMVQETVCQTATALQEVQLKDPTNFAGIPSVILRSREGSESLWEIAKRYSSTEEAIRQANELETEEIPQGQLLLIPRCRC